MTHPSNRPHPTDPEIEPDLLATLTGRNAELARALSLRTRRAVYNAAVDRRADRDHQRRHLIIALLITAALVFALAPALWDGIQGILAGEGLLDMPGMILALSLAFFAAVAAVLFLVGAEQQPVRHSRR